MQATPRGERGLTLIEIASVIVIMALCALVATPLVHHRYRSFKEAQLRATLNMMRDAIDRYHEYAQLGMIEPPDLDWNMYPESLDILVEGVEVKMEADSKPVVIKFLRRIPEDPFTGEAEWDCRAYDDEPDDRGSRCDDIYDVFSQSTDTALDGTYYADW